jgi:ATP-binding cassette, subfamily B, bacterial PglK
MKSYLHEIYILLGEDNRRLPGIIILFLVLSMIDLVGLAIIGPYVAMVSDYDYSSKVIIKVNEYIPSLLNPENVIAFVGLSIVFLFLFKAIVGTFVNYIIARFSVDQQTRLRVKLMRKYQSLPYQDYLKRNSSEYINSIQVRVNHYAKGVILNSLKMISDGLVAVTLLSFLIYTNFQSVIILTAIVFPALFIYDLSFKKQLNEMGTKSNKVISKIMSGIYEGMGGLKEVRILGFEDYFHNKVKDNSIMYAKYQLKSTLISSIPRFLIEFLVVLCVVIIVTFVFYFTENTQSFLPTLAVFGIAAMRLVPTVSVFSKGLVSLRYNRYSVSRLYKDISNETELPSYSNKNILSSSFKSLSLNNVSFNYLESQKVSSLNKVSLKINSGQAIGLIGASGSGKTTLVDLILGLLKPKFGDVLYNETPLEQVISHWRSQVAYIPQEAFLIDDSLKKNVALGVEENMIDDDKLMQSLKSAKLHELAMTMKDGLNTVLGERGVRLSGGQRQRVCLARAFYHDREVLILDEATSALDDATQSEIVSEIQQLKGKKTMIVIAHRLSTVEHCDFIYKLDQGKVVSKGTPAEILSR